MARKGKDGKKPLKVREKKFKFQTLKERIYELDIDQIRKEISSSLDNPSSNTFFSSLSSSVSLFSSSSSHLLEAVNHWKELNCTNAFAQCLDELEQFTLDQNSIIQNHMVICDILIKHFQIPNTLAIIPISNLISMFAKDLNEKFIPLLISKVLYIFLDFISHSSSSALYSREEERKDNIQAVLSCLFFLFKYLSKFLVREIHSIITPNLIIKIEAIRNHHIRDLICEITSFLLGKIEDLSTLIKLFDDLITGRNLDIKDNRSIIGTNVNIKAETDTNANISIKTDIYANINANALSMGNEKNLSLFINNYSLSVICALVFTDSKCKHVHVKKLRNVLLELCNRSKINIHHCHYYNHFISSIIITLFERTRAYVTIWNSLDFINSEQFLYILKNLNLDHRELKGIEAMKWDFTFFSCDKKILMHPIIFNLLSQLDPNQSFPILMNIWKKGNGKKEMEEKEDSNLNLILNFKNQIIDLINSYSKRSLILLAMMQERMDLLELIYPIKTIINSLFQIKNPKTEDFLLLLEIIEKRKEQEQGSSNNHSTDNFSIPQSLRPLLKNFNFLNEWIESIMKIIKEARGMNLHKQSHFISLALKLLGYLIMENQIQIHKENQIQKEIKDNKDNNENNENIDNFDSLSIPFIYPSLQSSSNHLWNLFERILDEFNCGNRSIQSCNLLKSLCQLLSVYTDNVNKNVNENENSLNNSNFLIKEMMIKHGHYNLILESLLFLSGNGKLEMAIGMEIKNEIEIQNTNEIENEIQWSLASSDNKKRQLTTRLFNLLYPSNKIINLMFELESIEYSKDSDREKGIFYDQLATAFSQINTSKFEQKLIILIILGNVLSGFQRILNPAMKLLSTFEEENPILFAQVFDEFFERIRIKEVEMEAREKVGKFNSFINCKGQTESFKSFSCYWKDWIKDIFSHCKNENKNDKKNGNIDKSKDKSIEMDKDFLPSILSIPPPIHSTGLRFLFQLFENYPRISMAFKDLLMNFFELLKGENVDREEMNDVDDERNDSLRKDFSLNFNFKRELQGGLSNFLGAIKHISNMNSAKLILELLSVGSSKIQLVTLEAYCNIFPSQLKPFQQELANILLSDTSMKSQLTKFTLDHNKLKMTNIWSEYLVPILIRLLYGRLNGTSNDRMEFKSKEMNQKNNRESHSTSTSTINRNGNDKNKKNKRTREIVKNTVNHELKIKRKIIMSYLSGWDRGSLSIFIDFIILQKGNSPFMIGRFLNLSKLIFDKIGTILPRDDLDKLSRVIFNIPCLIDIDCTSSSNTPFIHSDIKKDNRIVKIQNANSENKRTIKDIKTEAIKTIFSLFSSVRQDIPDDQDSKFVIPFLSIIRETLFRLASSSTPSNSSSSNSHSHSHSNSNQSLSKKKKSVILDLINVWSLNPRWHVHFFSFKDIKIEADKDSKLPKENIVTFMIQALKMTKMTDNITQILLPIINSLLTHSSMEMFDYLPNLIKVISLQLKKENEQEEGIKSISKGKKKTFFIYQDLLLNISKLVSSDQLFLSIELSELLIDMLLQGKLFIKDKDAKVSILAIVGNLLHHSKGKKEGIIDSNSNSNLHPSVPISTLILSTRSKIIQLTQTTFSVEEKRELSKIFSILSHSQYTDNNEEHGLALGIISQFYNQISCFIPFRIGEIDHDRQIEAFISIKSQISTMVDCHFWIPIINSLVHSLHENDELAIRNHALLALEEIIIQSRGNGERASIVIGTILPILKLGLESKYETVCSEFVKLLGILVANLSDYEPLILSPLLDLHSHDEELNFFSNLYHIQTFRRIEAIKRLKKFIKSSFPPLDPLDPFTLNISEDDENNQSNMNNLKIEKEIKLKGTIKKADFKNSRIIQNILIPLVRVFVLDSSFNDRESPLSSTLTIDGNKEFNSRSSIKKNHDNHSLSMTIESIDAMAIMISRLPFEEFKLWIFDLLDIISTEKKNKNKNENKSLSHKSDNDDNTDTNTSTIPIIHQNVLNLLSAIIDTLPSIVLKTQDQDKDYQSNQTDDKDTENNKERIETETETKGSLSIAEYRKLIIGIIQRLFNVIKNPINSTEIIHIPITTIIVSLLSRLDDPQIIDNHLAKLFIGLSLLLKNPSETKREKARKTLCNIIYNLQKGEFKMENGKEIKKRGHYLSILLCEMTANLRDGYQKHVCSYTVNAILKKLIGKGSLSSLPSSLSIVDSRGISIILNVILQDIFGEMANEKTNQDWNNKPMEVKAQTSFETMELLLSLFTLEDVEIINWILSVIFNRIRRLSLYISSYSSTSISGNGNNNSSTSQLHHHKEKNGKKNREGKRQKMDNIIKNFGENFNDNGDDSSPLPLSISPLNFSSSVSKICLAIKRGISIKNCQSDQMLLVLLLLIHRIANGDDMNEGKGLSRSENDQIDNQNDKNQSSSIVVDDGLCESKIRTIGFQLLQSLLENIEGKEKEKSKKESVEKIKISNEKAIEFFSSFIPLLLENIKIARFANLTLASVQVFNSLFREFGFIFPIFKSRQTLNDLSDSLFKIITKFTSANNESKQSQLLLQASYDLLCLLIKDSQSGVCLNDSQIELIIEYAKESLLSPSISMPSLKGQERRGKKGGNGKEFSRKDEKNSTNSSFNNSVYYQSFQLLKVLVDRQISIPGIYAFMQIASNSMITSAFTQVREQCRVIYGLFLLNYPLKEGKIHDSLLDLTKNMSYEHASGRYSILSLFTFIVPLLPLDVIKEFIDIWYVAIALRFAIEQDHKIMEKLLDFLEILLKIAKKNDFIDSFTKLITKWIVSDKIGVRRATWILMTHSYPILQSMIGRRREILQLAWSALEEKMAISNSKLEKDSQENGNFNQTSNSKETMENDENNDKINEPLEEIQIMKFIKMLLSTISSNKEKERGNENPRGKANKADGKELKKDKQEMTCILNVSLCKSVIKEYLLIGNKSLNELVNQVISDWIIKEEEISSMNDCKKGKRTREEYDLVTRPSSIPSSSPSLVQSLWTKREMLQLIMEWIRQLKEMKYFKDEEGNIFLIAQNLFKIIKKLSIKGDGDEDENVAFINDFPILSHSNSSSWVPLSRQVLLGLEREVKKIENSDKICLVRAILGLHLLLIKASSCDFDEIGGREEMIKGEGEGEENSDCISKSIISVSSHVALFENYGNDTFSGVDSNATASKIHYSTSVKKLALENLEFLEKRLGTMTFTRIYHELSKTFTKKREEREQEWAEMAIKDPQGYARLKVLKDESREKKKEHYKNRKIIQRSYPINKRKRGTSNIKERNLRMKKKVKKGKN